MNHLRSVGNLTSATLEGSIRLAMNQKQCQLFKGSYENEMDMQRRYFLPFIALVGALATSGEAKLVEHMTVLEPNSTYECKAIQMRVDFLDAQAQWVSMGPTSVIPMYSLHFGSSIDVNSKFLIVHENPVEGGEPARYLSTISGGYGLNWNFVGTLGNGLLHTSLTPAGTTFPVRMVWNGLSGQLFGDAYMYCSRTGPNLISFE